MKTALLLMTAIVSGCVYETTPCGNRLGLGTSVGLGSVECSVDVDGAMVWRGHAAESRPDQALANALVQAFLQALAVAPR